MSSLTNNAIITKCTWLYIFHIEVDFTEPLHCKQTHHPIMTAVRSRRHVSHNKLIVDVSQHQALFGKWDSKDNIWRSIADQSDYLLFCPFLYKRLQLSHRHPKIRLEPFAAQFQLSTLTSSLLWGGETLPIYLYGTQNLLSVLSNFFLFIFPHTFVSQIDGQIHCHGWCEEFWSKHFAFSCHLFGVQRSLKWCIWGCRKVGLNWSSS